MENLNDLQSMIIISCVSCVENWENKNKTGKCYFYENGKSNENIIVSFDD